MLQVSPTTKAKGLEVFGTECFLVTGQIMTGSYCKSFSSCCASPALRDRAVSWFVTDAIKGQLPREARHYTGLAPESALAAYTMIQ